MAELDQTRAAEAVLELIRRTQKGLIKWEPAPNDFQPKVDPGVTSDAAFIAEYQGKYLRVSRKSWVETNSFSMLPEQRNIRKTQSRLELLDAQGRSLWRFPHHEVIADLYKAASFQASNAQQLIEDLLSTDPGT